MSMSRTAKKGSTASILDWIFDTIRQGYHALNSIFKQKGLVKGQSADVNLPQTLEPSLLENNAIEVLPSVPLAILTEEQKQVPWTEANEASYQNLLESLKANPHHSLTDADISIITSLIDCYTTSGAVEFFQKYTEFFNILLDAVIKISPEDTQQIINAMENFHKSGFPLFRHLNEVLWTGVKHKLEQCDKISERFKTALEEKFSLARSPGFILASHFLPGWGREHQIYAAPPTLTYQDTTDHPFKSLATFAFPEYIDKALTQFDLKAYEAAKRDPDFQAIISEVVNSDKELVLLNSMWSVIFLYRGTFEQMNGIAHFFYTLGRWSLYPNITVEQLLPHPFLVKASKLKFKSSALQNKAGLNAVLAQVVGKVLIAEKHENLKDWVFLPKSAGKDPGFILESPERKQRLYAKSTDNMINELLCAKILNHLGIKMAETSLFATDVGNCFLVTRGLSRQYQKAGVSKHKLFKPFGEALPEPLAYGHMLKQKKFGSEEMQRNKVNDFITQLFSDEGQVTKISFVKLLLAGLMLGLSDLGSHGGNIGPLLTSKEGKITQKIGIVDYQCYPSPIASLKSINDVYAALKSSTQRMVPIFQSLFDKVTLEDVQKALEQLLSPKHYTPSQEGYFLTDGKVQQSFEVAIEAAFNETLAELKERDLLETLDAGVIKSLYTNKEIVLSNLRKSAECLPANKSVMNDFGRKLPSGAVRLWSIGKKDNSPTPYEAVHANNVYRS